MSHWFHTYKNVIQTYLGMFVDDEDIGRGITYKAYKSSSYNSSTQQQEFVYTDYNIRGIKVDAGAEANLGPLWVGIKNYRSQPSAAIQTGDFQYLLQVSDFPRGFEPSTKDQITDNSDILKVVKADNIFQIAFLVVVEGSSVT